MQAALSTLSAVHPRLRAKSAGLLLLSLSTILTGCGVDSFVPANALTPINPSPQIATGAWTIGGISATGGDIAPIGGFYGALTASGSDVSGAFTVVTSTYSGSTQPSTCAPDIGLRPVIMSGTATNGSLTLDSTFNGNQFHLAAQLSPDRRSILSGSFVVTGSCATTASTIFGYQTAPITGTYIGTSLTAAGITQKIMATLVQADSYWGAGYIPVTGSVLFQGPNCTATMQLNGSFLTGDQSWFEGYTSNSAINDAIMLGDDDSQNSLFSSYITINPWGYNSSTCGSETQYPGSSSILTRQ